MSVLRIENNYDQPLEKACSRCGVTKPLEQFRRQKNGRFGRRAECATCQSVYNVEWKRKNRTHVLQVSAAWREKNREDLRAKGRIYAKENRAALSASSKLSQKKYPERVRARRKRWKEAHPEAVRRHKQTDYERHAERYKKRVRAWVIAKPEMRRAQTHKRRALLMGAAGATYTTAAHIEARRLLYGGCCYYCGAENAASMDHRIPLIHGGSHWPANLVPACRSCNSRKHTSTERQFRAEGRWFLPSP